MIMRIEKSRRHSETAFSPAIKPPKGRRVMVEGAIAPAEAA